MDSLKQTRLTLEYWLRGDITSARKMNNQDYGTVFQTYLDASEPEWKKMITERLEVIQQIGINILNNQQNPQGGQ